MLALRVTGFFIVMVIYVKRATVARFYENTFNALIESQTGIKGFLDGAGSAPEARLYFISPGWGINLGGYGQVIITMFVGFILCWFALEMMRSLYRVSRLLLVRAPEQNQDNAYREKFRQRHF